MKSRLLAGLALVGALLVGTAGAQTTDTLKKIKASGVIQLGGRDASFPFSYKISADADPIGFSADLCLKVVDAVKAKLGMPGLKVQYTIVTPTNRIALVQNGTIDLECSTTTNTAARAQQVDFAPTHFVGSIAAAVKKSSGLTTVAQLDGKTVATVAGSTSIQLLRAYRRNEKLEIGEVSGKDTSETFLLLSSDRAIAMFLEDVQLAGLIARSANPGDYKLLDERLRDEPYGFMFRKGDPQFKALVDETMSRLMKSGEINDIYAKWFTRPVPPSGVNLNYPMPNPVKEAYRNPSNRGI
ncbi:amino acid ABC transporter substrate-binding protein, PAAT family [Sphaerotilus natans]|uniref:amino acid ABC transporter substrate-binding protein n=1 Tax=Sphaerotilus natans TaxID=34103 RepID=UPI00055EB7DB|nr:amino acid ABC transporter substrate-binding protein [Sphaerotilus natans]SIS07316.1 amino acid ABC transporter substrate-binding protein, PAAT family [Sphaerotilus natans]